MSGLQGHHSVLQSLYDDASLKKLFDLLGGRKWVDGPLNIIMLPNDPLVAEQADLVRHASSHPWIFNAQKQVLDQFYSSTFNGKRVSDILGNPTAYAADLPALTRRTETLLNDLRDASTKALIERRLPLTLNDALFPTITNSALNAESEEIIQTNLKAMAKGRTVIIIAHRLSAIRQCDRIVALEAGRIVETGTHDELLRHGGRYADLYRRQMGVSDGVTA